MHERNCFVTLTYSPSKLPADGSLDVTHWQKFVKRVRKSGRAFRYFHCGEYGDLNLRPHYHALIFGMDFHEDRELWKKNRHGDRVYISESLSNFWNKGFCSIGELNYRTAAYVARYVMKKVHPATSKDVDVRRQQKEKFDARYARVNKETGEEYHVKPEYVTMSRKPGIGSEWFEKYSADVFPSDEVVFNARRFRTPRFYDDLLARTDGALLDELKGRRRASVSKRAADLTPERLRVRERVLEEKMKFFKREV